MGLSSKDLPFQPTGLTAPAQRTGTNSTADPGASTDNLSPFIPTTKLVIPTDLPLPVVSLLHTLAEPSLLYSSLRDFIDSVDDTRGGLVGQSLRAAIETELKGYLELIGTVEGEIRRAVSMLDMDEGRGIGKTGVTLKRCVIWTREATMGLRLLSLIVEQAKGLKSPLPECGYLSSETKLIL